LTSGREVLGIGLGLAFLLGVLAAALQGINLGEGSDLPGATSTPGEGIGTRGANWSAPGLWALGVFVLAVAAVALLSGESRREAFLRLAAGLLLVVGLLAVLPLSALSRKGLRSPGSSDGVPVFTPALPSAARPDALFELPPWAASLAILTLAVVVARWAWRRGGRGRETFSLERESRPLPVADSPAPRPGVPAAGIVPLCWARMVRLLSGRSGVTLAPSVTPREFCESLEARGFREAAVWRLTELFEEVRYGACDDRSRREEALTALASLEEKYGPPQSERDGP